MQLPNPTKPVRPINHRRFRHRRVGQLFPLMSHISIAERIKAALVFGFLQSAQTAHIEAVKLSVAICGRNNEVKGEIVWDDARIAATGSPRVSRAARDPIAPWGIKRKIIKPDEQPEQFMRSLWLVYRSPYFRATKAVEN
jgi:hypothetical protein